ncbi:MAG: hypothetical protein LBU20_00380 [Candidatus Nomurabacteria bacterium]|nr:hypothetical protein [Candidatus Nomurabacteria bacterium]
MASYNSLYSTPSYTGYDLSGGSDAVAIWMLIAAILAAVGGVLVYVLFMTKKNEGKLKGFAKWLYEFLHFNKLSIEVVLKLTYIVAAIFITLAAFGYLGSSMWYLFFAQIIVGNIVLRICYELILVLVLLWRNTEDIKKAVKK